ncbi:MAG: DUF5723 family protein [Flavobacteriaceae bacterium]|nr:hypothetical protein [Flavobacteriaceae bacterium]
MRVILVFFVAFGWVSGFAQNKQVLYGFNEIPQSLLLNPGIHVPQKKHFGIPFLSQIHINGGSSGVSVYDIFGDTGEDINAKIEQKIFEMKNTDFFTVTQQLELINFGWRSQKDIYFSGGMYQEFDFITYFPRDLAILAWEGNANYLDYPFDLSEISTTGDLLTVFHFGANKKLTNTLTVGARVKMYSSIMSYRSIKNQGTFTTRFAAADAPNIYEHNVTDANVTVETSGIASLEDNFSGGEMLKRAFFGGNLGVGMDVGATYAITSNWTASASILDLGVIFHSKDVENYSASGDYTLHGIELIFPPLSEGEGTFPYYDDLEDEIEREIPIDTLYNAYSQLRPLKLHAGLEYGFGKVAGNSGECDCLNKGGAVEREQKLGLQYYSILRPKGPQMAGTLFYYRRLFSFLSAKITYTVDSFSYSNIGGGIAGDFGKFNFYVAADNMLHYGNLAKSKSLSLQLGFNIKIYDE